MTSNKISFLINDLDIDQLLAVGAMVANRKEAYRLSQAITKAIGDVESLKLNNASYRAVHVAEVAKMKLYDEYNENDIAYHNIRLR